MTAAETEIRPDAVRAYRALDLALAHPEHFHMDQWVTSPGDAPVGLADLTDAHTCGTTACFAGWTVALAGYRVDRQGRVYDSEGRIVSARPHSVSAIAAQLLRLDFGDADELFHWTPTEDIGAAVADVFGPRPAPATEETQ